MKHAATQWTLSAPSLESKTGVALTRSKPTASRNGLVVLPPHTAVLLRS
jgi:hypothetical protein